MHRLALAIACGMLVTSAVTAAQTTRDDLPRRDPRLVWPEGLTPVRADVFNHNELQIETGCDIVYRHLASPESWPSWLTFARNVRLEEPGKPLRVGARFLWSIFGTPITSTLYAAEPGHRFAYTNTPPGLPAAYAQSWLLTTQGKGCHVITEEVGVGDLAKRTTASGDRRVSVAHDLWLASLRWVSMFGKSLATTQGSTSGAQAGDGEAPVSRGQSSRHPR